MGFLSSQNGTLAPFFYTLREWHLCLALKVPFVVCCRQGVRRVSISTRERDVEQRLFRAVKRLGLACLKFSPDHKAGMPDRLILLPAGRVVWVELKTDNGRLSERQRLRHAELMRAGHEVAVIYTPEEVDRFADGLKARLAGTDSHT